MASTFDIDEENVNKFSYLIGYDISIFLDLYRMFVNNNLPLIINYFQNSLEKPDRYSFSFLTKLKQESIIVDNLIKTNLLIFKDMSAWEILDFFEDVKIKIDTFLNLNRWTRSSIVTGGYTDPNTTTPYTMGNYQTLEQISSEITGTIDSQNSWQDVALKNNLLELNYTTDGGNILNVGKKLNTTPNYFLNSIIDNLIGTKVYGLDINKKFQFINNDLAVLSYNDTVIQSVKILISLKKGDIPEFPTLGLNNLIGSNTATFYYVSLSNQLKEVFNTDDSLRDFKIKNIIYTNGDTYIDFQVNTFYQLVVNQKTKI